MTSPSNLVLQRQITMINTYAIPLMFVAGLPYLFILPRTDQWDTSPTLTIHSISMSLHCVILSHQLHLTCMRTHCPSPWNPWCNSWQSLNAHIRWAALYSWTQCDTISWELYWHGCILTRSNIHLRQQLNTTWSELVPHFWSTINRLFPALNVHWRNQPIAKDTVYSNTPAIYNSRTLAQIFVCTESLATDFLARRQTSSSRILLNMLFISRVLLQNISEIRNR